MNKPHTPLNLKFVDETNFESHILQSRSSVLVAFWTPWSKPCHILDPVLEEVARTCVDKIEVVKVNADDNPNLSLRFDVQHIPTLLLFDAGKIRWRLVGTASVEAILAKLQPLLTEKKATNL